MPSAERNKPMVDFIILAAVAAIIGSVVFYIRKEKKAGAKCIGCPDAKTCSGNCAGCGGCH